MPMFLFFQKRVANNVILELGPIRMKALVILHSIGIEISRFQGDALVYAVPYRLGDTLVYAAHPVSPRCLLTDDTYGLRLTISGI